MLKFFKVTGLSVFSLILVLAIFIGITWLRATSSVPSYDGELVTTQVSSDIDLIRDENGVIHIEANKQSDAYFALGYAHAQDRLWQMNLTRMQVAGRLAEIYGELALPSDIRMRTMGYAQLADKAFKALDDNQINLLASYTAGVNAYMASDDFELPPEFVLTFTEPEKWQAKHSLYVMFSFWPTLAGNSSAEIRYARLKNKVGEDIASNLARPFPKGGHVSLEREDLIAELGDKHFQEEATQIAKQVPTLSPGFGHSNNWVISGDKTKSGAPMLANDPHLGLTTPGVWYLARLSYENQTVRGVTIPGVPGVIIGRNNKISWGFTTTQADNEDVYIETLNKDDPEQYLTPNGWQTFDSREEIFKVRFSGEVKRIFKSSRHGPVLSKDLLPEGAQEEGTVLAISTTAHQQTDLTMSFFMKMNSAKNLDDVNAAAPFYSLPTHNMVVADTEGNIGYFMVGGTPLRGANHQSKGAFPVDGSVADNDWLGLVPYDERPRVRNPAIGQIITANGQITPDGYKHNITSNWPDPGRAERIEQQINNYEKHDLASFSQMQLDLGSTKTPSMLKILKQAEPTRELDKRAISLLNSWDGAYTDDAPQPAIYAAWTMALSDKIYEDELGELFKDYRGRRHQIIRDAFAGDLSSWCDDSRTQPVESCTELLVPSLSTAMDGLVKEYGNDIENWRWREQLSIRHSHLGLGSFPVLGDIFSRDTSKGGGPSSPNVTYWSSKALPRIKGVSHAASLRMISDMAEQNASRFIISSGQSGHFKSPHYDDLQGLWAEGKYIEIALDNEHVKQQHIYKITVQ